MATTPTLNEATRAEYNAYAIKHLREAIRLAPKYQEGWIWRVFLAKCLRIQHKDIAKWEESPFRKEGSTMLREAMKMGPPRFKPLIDQLIQNY